MNSSAARCTMVRTETGDGATLAGRPELRTILDFIHPGETLVVTRIDRLARSMRDLQLIVATLKDKGAHLAATEQPVDTSTAAGKAFFDILGVFAEFETNLRRERQAEGIAAARQRGAYRGRPPREAQQSVGSTTEIVVQLDGEWAFDGAVWTFSRRPRPPTRPSDAGRSRCLTQRNFALPYEHQTSDEAVDEIVAANEFTLTLDGKRFG